MEEERKQWKGSSFLVLVAYYSRYVELAKLFSTSSAATIKSIKSIFALQGIAETVFSDNGPQYASQEFQQFAKHYDFAHFTSSPRYPQSNGAAERAVQTVKQMLEKADDDPYRALLAYRATPLENGYSPAELLFGRRIRTTVPIIPEKLESQLPDSAKLRTREQDQRNHQKQNYNARHRAVERDVLWPGDEAYVSRENTPGTVVRVAETPLSYIVETPTGEIRRNRRQLASRPESVDSPSSEDHDTHP
ncbi:PREDICTED: uncharacterized protein K02A2.6-like [Priapulus caudatus]|uniref:Uncharacterized protein K02A2.6-like n=1 Tax=Priapulus caudatus TaxID=37621 RepID=A0ABM1ERB7_PRICU|nr:PREDICTED: uncharacterized protein K02A2.6-like [Priapulus caudatus]